MHILNISFKIYH